MSCVGRVMDGVGGRELTKKMLMRCCRNCVSN